MIYSNNETMKTRRISEEGYRNQVRGEDHRESEHEEARIWCNGISVFMVNGHTHQDKRAASAAGLYTCRVQYLSNEKSEQ